MGHKKAAGVLTHGAHVLAQIEEEASRNVLHDDEDEVVDDATRRLDDLSGVTEIHHADDAGMVEVLENGNLILDGEDRVFVTSEELFFQDLDCNLFGGGVLDRAG